MSPEQFESLSQGLEDLRSDMGRMQGTLANLATLVAAHLQCHGVRVESDPAATAISVPPTRPPQSSSVSLHAPTGASIAFRGPAALAVFVVLACLGLGAGAGYLAHASLHAASAAGVHP